MTRVNTVEFNSVVRALDIEESMNMAYRSEGNLADGLGETEW